MTKNDDVKVILEDLRIEREKLEKKEHLLKEKEEELIGKLSNASKLSREEAEKMLLNELSNSLTSEMAKKIRNAEERAKQTAHEKAKEILVDAMKHGATDYVAEYTISSIRVDSEEVKGRIIGKEGRNIRAFERAAQVEIDLDEPFEIRLSSFDPVRREVARRALLELIKDSRIQPSRIEEVVQQMKSKMEDVLLEEGKKIVEEVGEYNLPTDIVKMIGKFKFRTSYGQNLALHTIEETKIAMSIASELGANVETVRLGGLLHDIGKIVTDDERNHIQKGVDIAKKYSLPKEVVNIIAEHHEDKPFSSLESVIVWAADAISGSRPGARYEPHESYVKRMEKIEELAGNFDGVESAIAFQAGRDVRVVVKPDEVDDDRAVVLARDIANKLEREADYAGQVKVTVIREFRTSQMTSAK